jgi:hypothetical protein
MTYWFHHEYLDEARRFRIHRIEADNETQARKMHRQACQFSWVTEHAEPSVSSLFMRTEGGHRAIAPSHRPGDHYHTDIAPIPMPEYIRQSLAGYKAKLETDIRPARTVAET